MKTAVIKKTIWISHLVLAGILLNGCSDVSNQQHAQTANSANSQITALQVAMNQADDARQAIITADNNQRLARQEALNRQQAVQQAIAQASKETQQLRQDAENKARWATTTHHKAIASREALLQAAMQQANAKQQLLNAEQAVLDARHQFQMDQRDAELTANIQHEANKALNLVLEAEQLAALSMQQLTAKQSSPNQSSVNHSNSNQANSNHSNTAQAETTQAHAEKNVTVANKTHHKKSVTKHKAIAKKHGVKTTSKITKTVRNSSKTHRSLKLASLNSMQPEGLQRGRDLAQKCLLCHNLQPSSKKKFGPDLFTVFNQPAGKAKDYRYSNTLAKATFSWTEDNLAEWICHSGDSIKQLTGRSSARTKMSNQRICGQDAKDVVAYLRTIQSSSSIAVSQATSGRSLQLAGAI